jgi:hypothetical protein
MPMEVKWDQRAAEEFARDKAVGAMRTLGPRALDMAYNATPKDTGFAANSLFYVIVDDQGSIVGGNSTDRNGHMIDPDVGGDPGKGWVRMVLGANADYFVWIEIGTSTRPAHHVLANTLTAIQGDYLRLVGGR